MSAPRALCGSNQSTRHTITNSSVSSTVWLLKKKLPCNLSDQVGTSVRKYHDQDVIEPCARHQDGGPFQAQLSPAVGKRSSRQPTFSSGLSLPPPSRGVPPSGSGSDDDAPPLAAAVRVPSSSPFSLSPPLVLDSARRPCLDELTRIELWRGALSCDALNGCLAAPPAASSGGGDAAAAVVSTCS